MEGILQVVGDNQEVDSEKEKEATRQGQNTLTYPPEDLRHVNPQLSKGLPLLSRV
jgi:hypothetical protein